jgi:hypothetical protein
MSEFLVLCPTNTFNNVGFGLKPFGSLREPKGFRPRSRRDSHFVNLFRGHNTRSINSA